MILIPNNRVLKFTKTINQFKRVEPIKIILPDAYILPESILEDDETTKAMPELNNLELINEIDITFIKYTI
jgi:hypothetical protein